MKPLPVAPLTLMDCDVFARLSIHDDAMWHRLRHDSGQDADRRDAELMRLREASKAQSERYPDERWALHRRAWWPVHWGLA